MAEIDIGKLWQQACDEATSTHQPQDIFAGLVLEEAAKMCDRRFLDRAEEGFPREAASARALANTIRTIAEGLKP